MLGQQCQQHQAKNTYGTGCFVMLHTGVYAVALWRQELALSPVPEIL